MEKTIEDEPFVPPNEKGPLYIYIFYEVLSSSQIIIFSGTFAVQFLRGDPFDALIGGNGAPFKRVGRDLGALAMILLMATRNPARKPVEVGSLSIYLQGFSTIPGGCLGFLPTVSQVFQT